ncbi:LOW QUALITY PROTEIN: hypothetical protein Cgig2_013213 [Carnegiea gigantea]|uniref:Uncharacterized protein n=1 Tax=Carnegiea gigantea TaxID=171969 RepID=A0A9Q1KQL6_9CARY|nr:LOW QUALITY PROTEIN: hypothetical protein Cgig2_013213 [Carnegiea gigantea]
MTTLVTGSTKGIGHAIVEELANLGAAVHICACNETRLKTYLMDWKAKGLCVNGSICDVNNASGLVCKDTTAEDFSTVISLNFHSAFHPSQRAHPMLKASNASSIIFISSIASCFALILVLCMEIQRLKGKRFPSKWVGAINRLAKNLACEWAKHKVNDVAP